MWEYMVKLAGKGSIEEKTLVNLVYSEPKGKLTIPKIINTFSQWNIGDDQPSLSVCEMKCDDIFPINETLLPLFKRKLITYIGQSTNSLSKKIIKIN